MVIAFCSAIVLAIGFAGCLVLRGAIHNAQMIRNRPDEHSDAFGDFPAVPTASPIFHSTDLAEGVQRDPA